MQERTIAKYFFLVVLIACCKNSFAQNPQNWTSKELLQPSDLAAALTANKDIPVIFSVGPGAVISKSVDVGPTHDEKNLARFKEQVSGLAKSTNIVIYCGCCPFEHCPNVRPAIALLKSMQFTNYHLLNLAHNIKTDWISKGYPVTN
jgi:hypothetical protein